MDSKNFIRCHKSFIVNSRYIKEVRLKEMEIHMSTGDICYIGKKYKSKLLETSEP
ncbi:MAG: LytTR family transcriptional regulator [Clostridiaceae bacterium]|nr:LytTR family transcriptional regulator [Clostridiaceae bacterium]